MVADIENPGLDEGERFFPNEINGSDTTRALEILRTIRDDKTAKQADRVNSIKEINRITLGLEEGGAGPGSMTRAELQAALALVVAALPGLRTDTPKKA